MEDPQSLEKIVLSCNKLAMNHLRKQNFKSALHLLNRAKDLLKIPQKTPNLPKLLTITQNNLGCYYKQRGNNQKALKYFSQALKLQAKYPSKKVNLAGTHLNICSIRSLMKQHQTALKHALKAIQLLSEVEKTDFSINVKSTLVIALHNAGIESELMGIFQKAEEFYTLALEKGQKFLGHHNQITQEVLRSYKALTSSQKIREFQAQKLKVQLDKFQNRKLNFDQNLPKIRPGKSKKTKNIKQRVDLQRNYGIERNIKSARKKSVFQPAVQNRRLSFRPKARMQSAKSRNNLTKIENKLANLDQQLSQFQQKLLETRDSVSRGSFEKNKEKRFSKTPKTQSGFRRTFQYNGTPQYLQEFAPKFKKLYQYEISDRNFSENQIFTPNSITKVDKKLQETHNVFNPLERITCQSPSQQKISFGKFQNFTPDKLSNQQPFVNFRQPTVYLKPKTLAAIFIQKFVRRFLCRKKLPELKREKADFKAQIAINQLEQLQKLFQTESKIFESTENSQPSIRRPKLKKPFLTPKSRFQYKSLQPIPELKKQLQDGNIVAIQALIRGFIQKRRYLKIRKAAIKIQSLVRMRSVKNLYQDIYAAIEFIQENWRLYKKRHHLKIYK